MAFAYLRETAAAMFEQSVPTLKKQIFIDYSGSTSGCVEYWRIVKTVLLENPTAIVYLWDTICNKINYAF